MTFLLRPVISFDFRETTITAVIEDPEGHTIYVGNASADLASFDIRIGKLLGIYLGKCSGSIRFVAIHPQHQVIASCGLDRHLRVYVVSEDTPAHLCGFLEAASYRFCFRLRLQWRRFVFCFCLTSYGRITYMHVLYIRQASLTFELICQELKKMEQLTKLGREGQTLKSQKMKEEARKSGV